MNDRYLYRAKRKKWREIPKEKWWVEGYYAYMKPYHCIMTKDNFDSWIEIDEKTLCQCTGLKDKNGQIIWENDIIQCNGIITAVSWNKKYASLVLTRKRWLFPHFFGESQDPEECEVIGNIFDEGSENIGKGAEEN